MVTVNRYLYAIATSPTCGVGLRKTEVPAPPRPPADARVTEMIRDWTRGFAEQDHVDYRWSISHGERIVASGTSRPPA